jgi:hypothetical protein
MDQAETKSNISGQAAGPAGETQDLRPELVTDPDVIYAPDVPICVPLVTDPDAIHAPLVVRLPAKIESSLDAKIVLEASARMARHSGHGRFGYTADEFADLNERAAKGLRIKPAKALALREDTTKRLCEQAEDLLSRLPSDLPSKKLRDEMKDIADDLAKAFARSIEQVRKMLPKLWKEIVRNKNRRQTV